MLNFSKNCMTSTFITFLALLTEPKSRADYKNKLANLRALSSHPFHSQFVRIQIWNLNFTKNSMTSTSSHTSFFWENKTSGANSKHNQSLCTFFTPRLVVIIFYYKNYKCSISRRIAWLRLNPIFEISYFEKNLRSRAN